MCTQISGEWTRIKQLLEFLPENCLTVEDYLAKMSKNGSWGDGTMLMSLCYQRQVIVYYPQAEQKCSRLSENLSDAGAIRLGFVSNNHYVSLNSSSPSTDGAFADPKSVETKDGTRTVPITCSTCTPLLKVFRDSQNPANDRQFGDVGTVEEVSQFSCVKSLSVSDSGS